MSVSIISDDSYCSKLKYIPQFSGTCWFNSILNVMLYSTGMRRLLQNKLLLDRDIITKKSNDKLLTFLLFMLQNYNNIDKLEKVYKSFKDFRLKPEYLLMSYLSKYDIYVKNFIINNARYNINSLGLYPLYIINIFETYNIPYINIVKRKGSNYDYYINIKLNNTSDRFINLYNKQISKEVTSTYLNNKLEESDILLITENYDDYYDFTNIKKSNQLVHNMKTEDEFNEFCKDVKTLNPSININGYIYNLDSCIISNKEINLELLGLNYNKVAHAIAGISCDNNKYVIDSKSGYIIDEPKLNDFKYHRIINPNIKLARYNWINALKTKKSFEVDDTTNSVKTIPVNKSLLDTITSAKRNDLIYNRNSLCIFIYVKDKSLKSINTPISSGLNVNTQELLLSDRSRSKYYNDVYNIKNSTLEELAKYVKNITNAPHVYLDIEKYRLLYNYYNKPNIILSEKINEEDKEILLRNLFLTIIYDYLKNGKIALLNFYNDDSFFINFINKYKRYTLPNLEQELIKNGIKIRFESIEIELSSTYYNIFEKKNTYYDKYIISMIPETDLIKRIMIKILLHKLLYNIRII
jgi:hypothetical protein